jgi:hypothetical protein
LENNLSCIFWDDDDDDLCDDDDHDKLQQDIMMDYNIMMELYY